MSNSKDRVVLIIESSDDNAIFHCSVHEDPALAYGTAMLEMDQMMTDDSADYHFSSIYRLDADAGFGFDAICEGNEKLNLSALIVDISDKEGECDGQGN